MHTQFQLLATYGKSEIPVIKLAADLYGLSEDEAKKRAARQGYPFPVYRAPGPKGRVSQKSPWLADAADVAAAIDQAKEAARKDWKRVHAV